MNKLFKSLITLFLLVILVSCFKEEEIQNELISSDFQYSINSKIDLLIVRNVKDNNEKLNKYNFLEIKESDFEFSNNTFTIFKRYLDQEFAKDRKNLVLSMMYRKNTDYSNIFITIKNK